MFKTAQLPQILQLLYLLLPAFLANMAPPFVKYWPGWNRPIHQRWLGAHKTVIGFALGMVASIVATYAQSKLHWDGALISYANWPLLGLAIGFGAMSGDALKSLCKRKLGIAPGQSWMPADQVDYVIGALVFMVPWIRLRWHEILLVCAIAFIGNIAVNHVAYWLGIRDAKW
jgi:CDP-2,3-bis-(O-geranylgeranyl)-sn-glycerol synthase